MRLFLLAITLAGILHTHPSAAADNAELFALSRSGIFVIQVTDRQTGVEGVIGSGFLIDDALIATNYHVVSRQVLRPNDYALQLETEHGEHVPLTVVAVDAVHDLALVAPLDSEHDFSALYQFELADELPPQGTSLSAIGNPYDVGVSIVPGTYNGRVKHSYQGRLHFTGALNPGMSGGPAVDDDGRIVGVNVAGAGNSVSFLVPVDHLRALIEHHAANGPVDYDRMAATIRDDLMAYSDQLVADLLAPEWGFEDFGPVRVPSEITDFVDCSGGGSDSEDEQRYEWHTIDCGVYDRIFLSPELNTGTIELDYMWYSTEELGQLRFYHVLDGLNYSPFDHAGPDDVTVMTCHENITTLKALPREEFKAIFCVRAYLDYEGLYDTLFVATSLLGRDEAFAIHYTLAGVSKETAERFNEAFVGAIEWK